MEKFSNEKYKDFYKLWIDTHSDTFKEFQKSGHFASDMGVLMSRFMDFQKTVKELAKQVKVPSGVGRYWIALA